jgi:hypothetical protein
MIGHESKSSFSCVWPPRGDSRRPPGPEWSKALKFTRLNFFVPVPRVRELAELNTCPHRLVHFPVVGAATQNTPARSNRPVLELLTHPPPKITAPKPPGDRTL